MDADEIENDELEGSEGKSSYSRTSDKGHSE